MRSSAGSGYSRGIECVGEDLNFPHTAQGQRPHGMRPRNRPTGDESVTHSVLASPCGPRRGSPPPPQHHRQRRGSAFRVGRRTRRLHVRARTCIGTLARSLAVRTHPARPPESRSCTTPAPHSDRPRRSGHARAHRCAPRRTRALSAMHELCGRGAIGGAHPARIHACKVCRRVIVAGNRPVEHLHTGLGHPGVDLGHGVRA